MQMQTVEKFKMPTPREILEIFPKAVPTIKLKLREYQDELKRLEAATSQNLLELHKNKNLSQEYKDIIGVAWIEINFKDDEKKIKTHVKRLEHLLRIDEWKRKPPGTEEITDIEINGAKGIPIGDILGVPTSRGGFYRCPYHQEKTPSFKVFPDNRYNCFGCGENGDSIDLVMKLQKLSFIEAVKYLIKR